MQYSLISSDEGVVSCNGSSIKAVSQGKATVTAVAVYNGISYSAVCSVEVKDVYATGITVTPPQKSVYYIGDSLDTTGIEVSVRYSDGTDQKVDGFELSGFDSSTEGKNTVTVSYEGMTDVFSVYINTPTLRLPAENLKLSIGSTANLTATSTPSGLSFTWSSSDPSVVSVDRAGHIHVHKDGTAVITVSSEYNGITYSRSCTVEVSGYVNKFVDVNEGAWYASAVEYCVVKGYVTGTSETTFSPNSNITRAQFVILLAKLAGADVSGYTGLESGFSDVKQSHWAHKYISWAYQNGYVSGMGQGKFAPNANITREQLARMFYVYAEKNGVDVMGRADVSGYDDANKISSWARANVEWAVNAGLISGMAKTTLAPRGNATRAQAARMFMVFDGILS